MANFSMKPFGMRRLNGMELYIVRLKMFQSVIVTDIEKKLYESAVRGLDELYWYI